MLTDGQQPNFNGVFKPSLSIETKRRTSQLNYPESALQPQSLATESVTDSLLNLGLGR